MLCFIAGQRVSLLQYLEEECYILISLLIAQALQQISKGNVWTKHHSHERCHHCWSP